VRILVLNAGSSSLKVALVVDGRSVERRSVDWGFDATRARDRAATVRHVLADPGLAGVQPPDAVGHRIVHGGGEFREAVAVDDRIAERLRALEPMAPLHNPVAIDVLETARTTLPGTPHVATFDTAFHRTLPEAARRYPVPNRWGDWGVRRYGFHGLSVEWATERAAALIGRPIEALRIVVAHLGSGCSVTAVDRGRSVATSMGMTPAEGLMMGTRAGSIDPGILIRLLRDGRLTLDELAEDLEHRSGLIGIAGTSDVAALEDRATRGDGAAELALEMFTGRAAAGIAAAATALPALDAIVFTGGIGENAVATRARIVDRLSVLGIGRLGPAGESGQESAEAVLSRPNAPIAVLRVEAREELVIARHAQAVLEPLGLGGRPP
jgi:acetate kinase